MFNDLFNLALKRSRKQALGFAVAYMVGLVLAITIFGFVMGYVMAIIDLEYAQTQGAFVGQIVGMLSAIFATLALSYLILSKKGQLGKPANLVILLLSGAAAIIGGVILGLIPTAYLTTLDNNNDAS